MESKGDTSEWTVASVTVAVGTDEDARSGTQYERVSQNARTHSAIRSLSGQVMGEGSCRGPGHG